MKHTKQAAKKMPGSRIMRPQCATIEKNSAIALTEIAIRHRKSLERQSKPNGVSV